MHRRTDTMANRKREKKLITYKLTNIIAIEAIYLSKIIKTSKYKHI